MILIISSKKDFSTELVCLWLKHQEKLFKLIYTEDLFKIITFSQNSIVLQNKSQIIDLNQITSVWFRKGCVNVKEHEIIHKHGTSRGLIESHLQRENGLITEFINHHLLRNKKCLGDFRKGDLNKLIILEVSKSFKLNVPPYLLTSSKKQLIEFNKLHKSVIYKPITPGLLLKMQNFTFVAYTEELTLTKIKKLKTNFPTTFFQKKIEKKYEIRTFYLNNEFKSIAIFSQNNARTKLDYRRYDYSNPNREVAFKLSRSMELKLKKLINHIGINTCSIDLIYGKDNKYYFLEINPVGQFGNVSSYGNYYLERNIACAL